MVIRSFEEEDKIIANQMFENLKYLLQKYSWLEVYEYCYRTLANKMCGNVEGRCEIIANIKRGEYKKLKENRLNENNVSPRS